MLQHHIMRCANIDNSWNISRAGEFQSEDFSDKTTNINGLFFTSDGLKLFTADSVTGDIHRFDLSAAWDIVTAIFNQTLDVSTKQTEPHGLFFKSDGLQLFIVGEDVAYVHKYTLSVAWDLSTASYDSEVSVAAQESRPRDIFFKSDGTKMYVVGTASDLILQYNLTAWNITTASYIGGTDIDTETNAATGVHFHPDGDKAFIIENDDVFQYNLGTAWLASTGSYSKFFHTNISSGHYGLFFKPDGSGFFVSDDEFVYFYKM